VADAGLMQIVWSERGVQKFAGSVKAVELQLQLAHFCEEDSIAEVSRGEDRKNVSGGHSRRASERFAKVCLHFQLHRGPQKVLPVLSPTTMHQCCLPVIHRHCTTAADRVPAPQRHVHPKRKS
jgi:hypothetical protein